MKRTIKLKLDVSPEAFKTTIEAYTKAYNFVCSIGFEEKDFNNMSLHKKTYKITRTYLPSQLAISARSKAYWTLKALKKKIKDNKISAPVSKRNSIQYDANSYSVNFKKNFISILTLSGRVKIPLYIPNYFQKYMDWRRGGASLFIRKGKVYFNITFQKENPTAQPSNITIGIDRGINNIAVSSQNKFYSGKQVKRITNKYQKIKASLQSCGSKSAKRHLQKLSKKKNRFKTNINHTISKQIIRELPEGSKIILEDLSGIKGRRRGKRLNRAIGSWAYFQLEQFLTYKAEEKGIEIIKINPAYTSQKCSKCGHTEKANRKHSNFLCLNCGFQLNADLNAARNILQNHLGGMPPQIGVSVNNPIVSNQFDAGLGTSY